MLTCENGYHSPLSGQIDYTESTEIVSSDLVGSRYAGVVDATATIAQDSRCVLYVWYDNEFGYSCQVVHCMEQMMGVRYPTIRSINHRLHNRPKLRAAKLDSLVAGGMGQTITTISRAALIASR